MATNMAPERVLSKVAEAGAQLVRCQSLNLWVVNQNTITCLSQDKQLNNKTMPLPERGQLGYVLAQVWHIVSIVLLV